MTISYTLIARRSTILVSHQIGPGNFQAIVASMLPNIPDVDSTKTTYTAQSMLFHVLVDGGLTYLCAADTSFGRRVPHAFLGDIQARFTSGSLPARAQTAIENELQRDFESVLASRMEYYSTSPDIDNITQTQARVNEVKGIMQQNIEKVLERGDRLDDLLMKTDDLEASSQTFRNHSRQVARKMWWKNTKMMICMVCTGIIVMLVLTLIILFAIGVLPVSKAATTTTVPPTTTLPATTTSPTTTVPTTTTGHSTSHITTEASNGTLTDTSVS